MRQRREGNKKRVDPEGTTEEQLQSSPSFSRLSHRSDGKERDGEIRVGLSFSLCLLREGNREPIEANKLVKRLQTEKR